MLQFQPVKDCEQEARDRLRINVGREPSSPLLAIDGYRYGARDFDRSQTVERIAAQIPGLERVVRFGYLDGTGWEDGFLGSSSSELSLPLPVDHPLWILYSSGTTGLPKPIVHGQGGVLIRGGEE